SVSDHNSSRVAIAEVRPTPQAPTRFLFTRKHYRCKSPNYTYWREQSARGIDMTAIANAEYVTYELRGPVAHIGLNRAEKRNAISDAFVEAIADVVKRAESEARAAVIYGHGDHFCAGLDLAEHVKKTPIEGVRGSRRWHEVFSRI